jgi:hypothetical protein
MCLQAISAEMDRVTYRVPSFHHRAEPDQAGDHIHSVPGYAEGGVPGAKGHDGGGGGGGLGGHPHEHHQHVKNYHHTHQYRDVLPQTDGERILIKVHIWSLHG